MNDAYELIREYRRKQPNGHYFDQDTLRFFGERMSEMRLLKKKVTVVECGIEHECYVLSSLQRNAPYGPRRHHAYFDTETLRDVIPD